MRNAMRLKGGKVFGGKLSTDKQSFEHFGTFLLILRHLVPSSSNFRRRTIISRNHSQVELGNGASGQAGSVRAILI
jgi:hypothetical protein